MTERITAAHVLLASFRDIEDALEDMDAHEQRAFKDAVIRSFLYSFGYRVKAIPMAKMGYLALPDELLTRPSSRKERLVENFTTYSVRFLEDELPEGGTELDPDDDGDDDDEGAFLGYLGEF